MILLFCHVLGETGSQNDAFVVCAVRRHLRRATPGLKHSCMGTWGRCVLTTRRLRLVVKKKVLQQRSRLTTPVLLAKPATQRPWNGGSTTAQALMELQAHLSPRKGIPSPPSARWTAQEIRKMIRMTKSMKVCLKHGSKQNCWLRISDSPLWESQRSRLQQWTAT